MAASQDNLHYCPTCRRFARGARRCPACGSALRGNENPLWRWLQQPGAVSYCLIGASLLMFGVQLSFQSMFFPDARTSDGFFGILGMDMRTLILLGADETDLVFKYHQYWRPVSCMFLHGGLMHIGFNSLALRNIGPAAESIWGKSRMLTLYFITGVVGSVSSLCYYAFIAGQPIVSIGASGAILGILGLLLGGASRYKGILPESAISSLWQSVVFLGILGFTLSGIDNAAHVGGFIAGFIAGFLVPPLHRERPSVWRDQLWTALAVLSVLIMLACVGIGIGWGVLATLAEASQA